MAIDFSGTEYENEELEPLVTTSPVSYTHLTLPTT